MREGWGILENHRIIEVEGMVVGHWLVLPACSLALLLAGKQMGVRIFTDLINLSFMVQAFLNSEHLYSAVLVSHYFPLTSLSKKDPLSFLGENWLINNF